MSTEFMFLFCSKCKLLHHQKLRLSQFSENCMDEFAWVSELQSPSLPPAKSGQLCNHHIARKSPAAHCFFGARGLGFEQSSYVGINSSTKSFGIRRRAAVRFPRIYKLSAIELLINDAWFLAKKCIRDQDRLCFHLCES
ncbi:hypothetical protein [Ochrobactrum sp. 19YEA23]|uniref:hypothetical protein n=1 Tax=Ochrobactrum sp. 19YEA23 TaxID=3039854 RepID=UPI00247A5B98